ncbi:MULTISPECIES: dual OB domain-containing protein [unclassified Microcoleus]|uniref:dual OB domain-containing protein n=1 Tax=unclassified Microcoleus TaxID=2642155 RepID=UPI002FD20DD5
MTRIICLANSWKRGDRCIAGINELQGKWVRPVSDLPDGQIPKEMRQINRLEPGLLDVLEIPLAKTGPDFGFECENLSVLPGKWRQVGKVPPAYLLKYCQSQEYILHNDLRYVTVEYMQSLPMCDRLTLQLLKAVRFTVKKLSQRFEGGNKWEGSIVTPHGQRLTATITDPVFIRKLELGYRPQKPCLVTVSLSMPWRPDDWEGDDPCWKLIAGVIELPEGLVHDEVLF